MWWMVGSLAAVCLGLGAVIARRGGTMRSSEAVRDKDGAGGNWGAGGFTASQ